MNLTARLNYHKSEVIHLSARGKAVAARAHALRAVQIQRQLQLLREIRAERREKRNARV